MAALIAGVILAVFGLKLRLIRDHGSEVPTVDQWYAEARALLIPLSEHSLKAKYFFVPHNEHRIVLTRVLNLALTETNRQWDPILEMATNALLHAALAGALAALAWRHLKGPCLAGAIALLLALFAAPCAWENTLGGFQSQFYFMQLTAVGLLWLTLPARPLGRRWWAGLAVGVLALGTMASGFIAAVAVLATCLLRTWNEGRRSRMDPASAGVLAILCLGGALLVHTVPGSVQYRPSSAVEWMRSVDQALSWPAYPVLGGVFLLQLPGMLLVARALRRRSVEPGEWILVGLCLWTWIQMALQAYGRGKLGILPKYADLYTIGLFANALALARLSASRPRLLAILCLAWGAVFAAGLRAEWRNAESSLAMYDREQNAQAALLRDFNRTGDGRALLSTPAGQLPYPSASRLADVMAHPGVHPLLPEGIRQPIPLHPAPGTSGFSLYETPVPEGRLEVQDYAWMALSGHARFVSDWLAASDLPWMKIRKKGDVEVFAETPGGIRLDSRSETRGEWTTVTLRRVDGPVRIVAETPGASPGLFTNPVESGMGTHWVQGLLGWSGTFLTLGLSLAVLAISILLRQSKDRPVQA